MPAHHVTASPGRAACGQPLPRHVWAFVGREHAAACMDGRYRMTVCARCARKLGLTKRTGTTPPDAG